MKKLNLILFPAAFSLLISCDSGENFIERNETNQSNLTLSSKGTNSFSGKEMFEGIFFLKGDFTATIPTLKLKRSQSTEVISEDYIKLIENFIEAKNPLFFQEFASTLNSKDAFEIENIISESNKLLIEFHLGENNESEIEAYMDIVRKNIDFSEDSYFSTLDLSKQEDKYLFVQYLKDNYDIHFNLIDKISGHLLAKDRYAFYFDYSKIMISAKDGTAMVFSTWFDYNDFYGDKLLITDLVSG